jgi:hypothetical protein
MVSAMHANDVRSSEPVRHGAYLCISSPRGGGGRCASVPVQGLADRLGLHNEYEPDAGQPPATIAFLRRAGATPAHIPDDRLVRTDAIVHVAATTPEPVAEFCAGMEGLLAPAASIRVLGGVMRPKYYTGIAMHNFAYARQVLQQPGTVMPNALLVPLSKTTGWWEKDWMEQHTYFLPRYDETGRMLHEGHALAAAAGVPRILRRTYKYPDQPAPAGAYDFLTYFECSDEDLATFHQVHEALRDVKKNPEWQFVREGPTWQGRRVADWAGLFE